MKRLEGVNGQEHVPDVSLQGKERFSTWRTLVLYSLEDSRPLELKSTGQLSDCVRLKSSVCCFVGCFSAVGSNHSQRSKSLTPN